MPEPGDAPDAMSFAESSVTEAADESVAELLMAFWRALGTWRLYPDPTHQPAFTNAVGLMKEGLEKQDSVVVRVLSNKFDLTPSAQERFSEHLNDLARGLFERGVQDFAIRSLPEPQEFAAVVELLAESAESVSSGGGPKEFLESRGVLSIRIIPRDLVVESEAMEPELLPPQIAGLLGDPVGLAHLLEESGSAQKALEHLQGVLEAGIELGVLPGPLYAAVGDTVASTSDHFRAELVEVVTGELDDHFATAIAGQLSDGELSEGLVARADARGIEATIAAAKKVVEISPGRRDELPAVVAKKLIKAGHDSEIVLKAFGVSSSESEGAPDFTAVAEIAREAPDLAELRLEARMPSPEVDLKEGIATFSALLRAEGRQSEFEQLAEFGEDNIRRSLRAGLFSRGLQLLEALVREASSTTNEKLRDRLNQATNYSVTPDLVSTLLGPLPLEQKEAAKSILAILRERSVPALLTQLAEEPDRNKRKSLIEMLAEVASHDQSIFFDALNDSRWYFVRNVATILGRSHSPAAYVRLAALMAHADPRVRKEAVKAVAATGGTSAVPQVRRGIADEDGAVRLAALLAAGSLRTEEVVPDLIAATNKRGASLAERKEALNSLILQPGDSAKGFVSKTAKKVFPPTESNRQLSAHARKLLDPTDTSE